METNIEFSPIVREGERIDEIGFGGYKLIQKPEEFCYGVDSVLLSDFASLTDERRRRPCDRSGERNRSNSADTLP